MAVASDTPGLTEALRRAATPLQGSAADQAALMDRLRGRRFVLLGEASHGTAEFYDQRARITRRLIEEGRCHAVAVEADWPDAYRVNRYVRGLGNDTSPEEALGDFRRFPRWMWRNHVVRDFIGWLRGFNAGRAAAERVGFYGLDLYSLYSSAAAVVEYLAQKDPHAATQARHRYGCLGDVGDEPQQYGYGVLTGVLRSCRGEVVSQLIDLRNNAAAYLQRDGLAAEDEQFTAEQNARLVVNAEGYYRQMFGGRINTWNLRDQHMADTLFALAAHLERTRDQCCVAVWAHNSHLGDASATSAADRDELNLGQLVRRAWRDESALVGFTTYGGTVSAADDWDQPVQTFTVNPSLPHSLEAALHATGHGRLTLVTDSLDDATGELLDEPRLQRMIGVIYRPRTELQSHYLRCRAASQYDAIIHLDHTSALRPLDAPCAVHEGLPETFPSGL